MASRSLIRIWALLLLYLPLIVLSPHHTAASEAAPAATAILVDSGQRLGNGGSLDVALGDLDGDGDIDAYVANSESGEASDELWLNDGSGTFHAGLTPGGIRSNGVVLADLNGDTFLDAAVSNRTNIALLYNEGGQLVDTGQRLVTPELTPNELAGADVDGDGDQDLLVVGIGPSALWLNGQNEDPPGGFSLAQSMASTHRNLAVALADVTLDGAPDAVIAGEGKAQLWVNNGTGNFEKRGPPMGSGPGMVWDVAVAELDGREGADLVLAMDRGDELWLNRGGGLFYPDRESLGRVRTLALATADLNGDGWQDLYTANVGSDQLWLNDGDGDFWQAQSLQFDREATFGVAFSDLNGDSRSDAFVVLAGPNQVLLNHDDSDRDSRLLMTPPGDVHHVNLSADLFPTYYWFQEIDVAIVNTGREPMTDVTARFDFELAGQVTLLGVNEQSDPRRCGEGRTSRECAIGTLAGSQFAAIAFELSMDRPRDTVDTLVGTLTIRGTAQATGADTRPRTAFYLNRFHYYDCQRACTLETIFCQSTFHGGRRPPPPAAHATSGAGAAHLGSAPALKRLTTLGQTMIQLPLYYHLRDHILSRSPAGQHYVDFYYTHDREVLSLLTADQQLWDEAIATLRLWEPNLAALIGGQGATAIISAEQVGALDQFLTHLSAAGSPALSEAIADELERLPPLESLVGRTMTEAQAVVIGQTLHLPLLQR